MSQDNPRLTNNFDLLGKVSVESTKLEEMKDFITVAHSHSFMAASSDVCKQVSAFLAEGKFKHEI